MKVYVDELPKSCEKCKFYEYEIEYNGEWGFETHRHMCKINGSLIQGICPLQSLTDHDKQVRKEMCNDFKSRFLSACQIEKGRDTASFSLEVLNRILDQIQGETR